MYKNVCLNCKVNKNPPMKTNYELLGDEVVIDTITKITIEAIVKFKLIIN